MRHVVADPKIPTTGGFVCTISNWDRGFRHSVYSDMLFNWPAGETEDFRLQLTDKIDFGASGENSDYAGCSDFNSVHGSECCRVLPAKARKLFLFYGVENGLANICRAISNVEPADIGRKLTEAAGIDLGWLMWITAAASNRSSSVYRSSVHAGGDNGVGFSIHFHANTFPGTNKEEASAPD